MSALNIPQPHREALSKLAKLDDSDYNQFVEALASTQAAISMRAYANRVAAKLPEDQNELITNIIRALIPLFWLLDETVTKDKLATDVARSLSREASGISEEDSKSLIDRLVSILQIEETLGTTAKATLVYTDHQHTYSQSSILTDIRPIFMTDPTKQPVASAIVHTLKIKFHQDEEKGHREFFVAMDAADLIELVVVRAKQKAESIGVMMELNHIPILTADKD
jgi:hypothetical protein